MINNINRISSRVGLLKLSKLPRLPLEGSIDLTYRCNNFCRHCWLWEPSNEKSTQNELTMNEIFSIVDDARSLGCRRWSISGGEPMIREDFFDIFDYITSKSEGYHINTNGTLITPKIAKLLTRKGVVMIALYGATPEVYDHVTRHPGGFDKLMQGVAYMKEAGVNFVVQLIPMKSNFHQWNEMIALSKQLSPNQRIGAEWIHLSGNKTAHRDEELINERLSAEEWFELEQPNYSSSLKNPALESNNECASKTSDEYIFKKCIESRNQFVIDPYGMMTWCRNIQDPKLHYNLRQGTFIEAWEEFIPSCIEKVKINQEYLENCGNCDDRNDCMWCASLSYLETGRYTAPIPNLCELAKIVKNQKEDWQNKHVRYFDVAGISVKVESSLDFGTLPKFKTAIRKFEVDRPGSDLVTLNHFFFGPPKMEKMKSSVKVYNKSPWAVSKLNGSWVYQGIGEFLPKDVFWKVAVFNSNHTSGIIYNTLDDKEKTEKYGFDSLSKLPSDQIWLCPVLADRQALLIHSAAVMINGKGYLFLGQSGAGKSTTIKLLRKAHLEYGFKMKILCDDRNIVRKWSDGWKVHGTWSHGTINTVNNLEAPIVGILVLKKDASNRLELIQNKNLIRKYVLTTLIHGLPTNEWWQKELDVIEKLITEIPFYEMYFNKNGEIVRQILSIDGCISQDMI